MKRQEKRKQVWGSEIIFRIQAHKAMYPDPRADTACKNVWWWKKLIETKKYSAKSASQQCVASACALGDISMFAAQSFNTRTYPLQKSLIPLSVFYRPGRMIKCIDWLPLMETLSSSITILYHYIPIYVYCKFTYMICMVAIFTIPIMVYARLEKQSMHAAVHHHT